MSVRENVRLAAQARLTPARRLLRAATAEHAPTDAAMVALERSASPSPPPAPPQL